MKKKTIKKYQDEYMSIGMCLGIGIGAVFGKTLFDNTAMGISSGLCIGMSVGSLIGRDKDKKIAAKKQTEQ
ncbi:MAG: hypothetical protein K2G87_08025 [Oscillospiraceae bacterium]|nr:hypothetical protein [Oscillospiraceae bacterium]